MIKQVFLAGLPPASSLPATKLPAAEHLHCPEALTTMQ
jgi:hypothetical protein